MYIHCVDHFLRKLHTNLEYVYSLCKSFSQEGTHIFRVCIFTVWIIFLGRYTHIQSMCIHCVDHFLRKVHTYLEHVYSLCGSFSQEGTHIFRACIFTLWIIFLGRHTHIQSMYIHCVDNFLRKVHTNLEYVYSLCGSFSQEVTHKFRVCIFTVWIIFLGRYTHIQSMYIHCVDNFLRNVCNI